MQTNKVLQWVKIIDNRKTPDSQAERVHSILSVDFSFSQCFVNQSQILEHNIENSVLRGSCIKKTTENKIKIDKCTFMR